MLRRVSHSQKWSARNSMRCLEASYKRSVSSQNRSISNYALKRLNQIGKLQSRTFHNGRICSNISKKPENFQDKKEEKEEKVEEKGEEKEEEEEKDELTLKWEGLMSMNNELITKYKVDIEMNELNAFLMKTGMKFVEAYNTGAKFVWFTAEVNQYLNDYVMFMKEPKYTPQERLNIIEVLTKKCQKLLQKGKEFDWLIAELRPDRGTDFSSFFAQTDAPKEQAKKPETSRESENQDSFKKDSEEARSESKQGDKKDSQGKPSGQNNKPIFFNLSSSDILISIGVALLLSSGFGSDSKEISYQEFRKDFLSKGFVKELVIINKTKVSIVLNENGKQHFNNQDFFFMIGSVESFEHNLEHDQSALGIQEDFKIPLLYIQQANYTRVILQVLPTALMIGGLFWLTRKTTSGGLGGGIFNMGKSKAKKFNIQTDVNVKFKDVAGCDEAKEEIMEFVKFLKNPAKYEKLGAKIPRGAILSGPPGTGKTLLAKATAGEAGVPFYSISGSEFIEMFVGVGASRVRDLFKTARENAPSIIFVDEIDAIGKKRSNRSFGGSDERETTLNQLLVEMDGFNNRDHVVVLAGTNRPDVLDNALLRPGRFDRHINIDNPELEGRKSIFKVHLAKLKLNKEMKDIEGKLAALTPGFSGADIANVCNEAALIAARQNCDDIVLKHFEQAIERVIGGIERKTKLLSKEEKKIVAYHEAGHAICGWYLKYADPLLKVSIIPRGQGALGYAQYLPPDIYLLSVEQLKDRMTMTLGGRVSEELHFESVTSGASDDFQKVTKMATSMVTSLGMSEKLGYINYERQNENDLTKPFSENTGKLIDEEIRRIINECYDRCKQLLQEKSEDVEKVAQELLKKEVITREDMIRLLGKRPFPEQSDAFDKYLEEKEKKQEDTTGSDPESKSEPATQ